MGMGRRQTERQQELWVATAEMAGGPRHVFYERLNDLLATAGFDPWIEARCESYYCPTGRDSIPPGTFFRMLFIGYFEGIDSQRGIAWRCEDSLSLRKFLGFASHEETPDHSSLSRIRGRLPKEVFDDVFRFVLQIVNDHKLLDAKTVGVDATTLEANAAMKSIVRKDTGEDWEAYLKRLAAADGIELKTKAELIRYDKERNKQGKKKVSNDEWVSPADPEARIAKMKDGTTRLAYKAEHVVDLKSELVVAAEVYSGNQPDTDTIADSLLQAQVNLNEAESDVQIEEAAADKGYHAARTLELCQWMGVRTYVPEPRRAHCSRWTDKPEEHQKAVLANRRRTKRAKSKCLQRLRSERVERSFAHVCDSGGARRSWLRGIENVSKRYLIAVAAHNLGRILRMLFGIGKPKALQGLLALAALVQLLSRLRKDVATRVAQRLRPFAQAKAIVTPLIVASRKPVRSTGC